MVYILYVYTQLQEDLQMQLAFVGKPIYNGAYFDNSWTLRGSLAPRSMSFGYRIQSLSGIE